MAKVFFETVRRRQASAKAAHKRRKLHGQNQHITAIPHADQFSLFEISQRFWSKVREGTDQECWPWEGATTSKGYGRFKIEGRLHLAHRVAWILKHGPIPLDESYHGRVVMHACDNPRCCNPAHLRLADQRANVADMVAKSRR